MTPPPDVDTLCTGCFLYEQRGGRVCPMLDRQAEQAGEAERRATERLRALVLADAPRVRNLVEMICQEAEGRSCEQPASTPLALPAAPTWPVSPEPRKEPHVVRTHPV
jgi:hypothetical protein